MKKLILFLAFLYCINPLYSQNKNEYLVAYGQTWGFLKYFHPHPSTVNWDDALLKDYDELRNCSTDKDFNEIITQLISQCGDYKKKERQISDSLVFTESFEWINNPLLSEANRAYLKELKRRKPKFKNKYVRLDRSAFNPIISNEVNYPDSTFSNAICYLGITRYWNVINYYFPYRRLIKNNWDSIYLKHIPEFISLSDMDSYYLAVRRLNAKINDGHASTISRKNLYSTYARPSLSCQDLEGRIYIDDIKPTCTTQFRKSDQIIAIDNVSIDDRYKELSDVFSASNNYYLKKISYCLLLTQNDSIEITVKRGDSLITDRLKTYPIKFDRSKMKKTDVSPLKKKASYYILPMDSSLTTGYIHMGRLKKKEIDKQFKKTILKTKNLIIDCRNYPNFTFYILRNLLFEERNEFCSRRLTNLDYPGSFIVESPSEAGKKNKKYYKGKIYLLVDNSSMSRSEFSIMVFQSSGNVITIGGQTAGADGTVSKVPMPFGLFSYFSGCGIYYPNGEQTQQVGVRRDYHVVQDSSYLNGNDKILNYALDLICKSRKDNNHF